MNCTKFFLSLRLACLALILKCNISFAQCPPEEIAIIDVQGIGCTTDPIQSGTMCPLDFFTIFLEGDLVLPPNAVIDWYKDTDSNVDIDDDHYIGTSFLNPNTVTTVECMPCPEILGILVDACQGGSFGNEFENEFAVLSSGGGFNVDDFQFNFADGNNFNPNGSPPDQNNDINYDQMGALPCGLKFPDPFMLASIQNDGCTNVFGAGPGDFIPAGAFVILFSSCHYPIDYDFSSICGSGAPIYILQSACTRNIGAFTNPTGAAATRTYQFIVDGPNCDCQSNLTYPLNDPILSGIPNGGGAGIIYYGLDGDLVSIYDQNCNAPPVSLIPLPPLTVNIQPFSWIVAFEDCGTTVHIQGVLSPAFDDCAATLTDIFSFDVECEEPTLSTAEICVGETYDLDDLNISGYNGGWVLSDNTPISDFMPTMAGEASFIFYPSDCCIDSAVATINVIEGTPVDVITDTTVCLTFGILDLDGLILTDPIPDGTWSTGSSDFDPSTANPDDVVTVSFTPEECGLETTIDITISPSPSKEISEVICENDTITILGNEYYFGNETDSYTISSSEGCDTLVAINVSFFSLPNSIYRDSICIGDEVIIGDSTFNADKLNGSVLFGSSNPNVCDSIVNVEIHLWPETADGPDVMEEFCAGSGITLTVAGSTFSENMPMGEILLQDENGCDSSFMVILTYIPAVMGDPYENTFCSGSGESITFGTDTFDESNPTGQATIESTQTNCDSTFLVMLEFTPGVIGDPFIAQECENSGYSVSFTDRDGNNLTFDENNPNGSVTVLSQAGCDSTFQVMLEFTPGVNGDPFVVQECEDSGYSVSFTDRDGNNLTFDENNPSGSVTVLSQAGCDSTFQVMLEFTPGLNGDPFVIQECENSGYSISFTNTDGNNLTFDENNPTGSVTVLSQAGCDSTFQVMLDFTPGVTGDPFVIQECENSGYSISFTNTDGTNLTFDESNPTGAVTVLSQAGCDSTFQVMLDFIAGINGDPFIVQECENSGYSISFTNGDGNNLTFDENNPSGSVTVLSNAGCDSTFQVMLDFTPSVIGDPFLAQECAGSGYSISFTDRDGNNLTFDQNNPSGSVTVLSDAGCDSTFQVMLDFVSMVDIDPLLTRVCENSGYSISFTDRDGNIVTFDQDNPFGSVTLLSSVGCDSTFEVVLDFIDNIDGDPFIVQECENSGYSISFIDRDGNNLTFDENNPSGAVTVLSQAGCDSTFQVMLDFTPGVTGDPFVVQECENSGYSISFTNTDGTNLTFDENNPTGSVTVLSDAGCDSTFQVMLDFTAGVTGDPFIVQECENSGYSISFTNTDGTNLTFDENNPTGSVTVLSDAGCDSTFQVMLDFTPGVTGDPFIVQECENSGYSISFTNIDGANLTFDESNPTGSVTVLSDAGCDSTFQVMLDFTPGVVGPDFVQDECQGSGYTVSFTSSNGNMETFDEDRPNGEIVLVSTNGCDSTIKVQLFFYPATENFVNMDLCSGDSFELVVGSQTFNEENNIGMEVLVGGNSNACDSTVFVELNYSNVDIELLADQNEICFGDEITFTVNYDSNESITIVLNNAAGEPIIYEGINSGFTFSLSFDTNDNISLNSVDGIDCANLMDLIPIDIRVSNLSVELLTSDYNGYNISCFDGNDGFININFGNPGVGVLDYQWSNNAATENIGTLSSGYYEVTVTDEFGCESIVGADLIGPEEIDVQYEVFEAGCNTDEQGSISVNNVTGGTGVYTFSLGDEIVPLSEGQTSALFDELAAGTYNLQISDANNCSEAFVINVESSVELSLESVGNVEISLGENYNIQLQSSFDIDSIVWIPSVGLSCNDCENPIANPIITTTYEVMAWDEDGCMTSETITIVVRKSDSQYYIPTAFSPNGDGINDEFNIYAGAEILQIQRLAIFDRWGNQVFLNENFQANTFSEGWNGKFRSKNMPSGIYVFYAIIELINGETILEKGDLSLLK